MEEVEMDEEPEKMSVKRRRSSILKLPKGRSPFGDVDVSETCAETTLSKTTRRVSFASSNLVKPFVADPDKNTIWDTTYEEEINHTDSTQSSQEHSNKINSTLFSLLKAPVSLMDVSTVDMDLTKGALIDKENIPQWPRISIVDYAKKSSTNLFLPLYSLPSHNQSLFQTETMEFTCQNFDPSVTLNGAEADVSEMELTEISANACEEVTNKSFCAKDFVCQVPMSKTDDGCEDIAGKLSTPEKTGNLFMDLPWQNNETSKTNKSPSDQIPWKASDELSKMEKSCANKMEFTCQSVEVSKKEESISMELTCQVTSSKLEKITKMSNRDTSQLSTKCQSNEVSKVEKSLVDNMEFTCQFPTVCHIKEVSEPENFDNCETKCQQSINVSKSEKSADFAQMSCDISKVQKSFGNNIKLTCQLPSVCQIREISKSDKSTDCDMEFTCQIPPSNLEDTEFICQSPAKFQNNEMWKSDYKEIQITPASDLENKNCLNKSKKEKSCVDDMEFTCQISTVDLAKADRNKSRLEKSGSDMEFTCQLPSVYRLNDVSKLEKSVDCDMEFTCQIPQSEVGKVSMVPKTDESVAAEMDFTCQIPLTERTSCTDAEFPYQIPKQKSDMNVVEFNQCIPDELSKTENVDFSDYIPLEKSTCQSQSCQMPTTEVATVNENCCQMSNLNKIAEQSRSEETSFINSQINNQVGHKLISAVVKPSKLPIRSPIIRKNLTREDAEVINKNESGLDLTCTSPAKDDDPPKNILYSQKIPPDFKPHPSKHTFSDLKTPDPSFRINLTNISSGVDDTQVLLHCTYTKPLPECLIASRCEFQECICTATQEIGDVSVPKVPSLSQYDLNDLEIDDARNSSGSQDMTLSDIQRNKLATVNDTYVLVRKSALNSRTTESDDVNTYLVNKEEVEDNDTSLGFLEEEQLVVPDMFDGRELEEDVNFLNIEQTEENDVDIFCPEERTEIKLKEFKFTIKRSEEVSHLIERVEKRRKLITEFLENFKLREIHVPEQFVIPEKSSSEENELSVEKTIKSAEDIHPTLIEIIRKRQESSQNAWQLERVDDAFYYFSTLFGTLIFVIELNLENGTVRSMKRSSNLRGDTDPRGLYIMKLFLEKLGSKHVKAAIGEHFDVLSLLDYIEMTMIKLMRLQEDLMNCSNLTITRDYIAKFKIISVPLTLIGEISVDVSDLENLNIDDVKICTEKGVMNEKEFKRNVKDCPKGYGFFKEFDRRVDEYLTTKEKRKKSTKPNNL